MSVELSDFISIYRLTSGRAAYALRQALAAVQQHNLPELGGPIELCLASALRCRELELRYKGANQTPLHGKGANQADAEFDRGWSRLASTLANAVELFGAGSVESTAAKRLLDGLFPKGVAAITSLPYIEEHESARLLLGRMRSAPLAAEVATLHLEGAVQRLSTLTDQLGMALEASDSPGLPKWDEVRTARLELHPALLGVIARVCGTFAANDASSSDRRTALLAPLLEQQERMASRYRARLGTSDVDPTTGEEEQPLPTL